MELETKIAELTHGTEEMRALIVPESVLTEERAITIALEFNMQQADAIRTLLLSFKKDGRSDKTTMYNDVLNKFVTAVQSFELLQEKYDALLRHAFSKAENVLSVKKIGDTHYLVRENTLLRFGFGDVQQRDEKLANLQRTTTQLKAMLVGLEFLVYSSSSSVT